MLFKEPPLPPLPDLLKRLKSVGEKLPKDLREDLLAYGDELKKPLLDMALDEKLLWAESYRPEVWVVVHALVLLADLGAVETAEALVHLLDEEQCDTLRENLRRFFGRIGPGALPVLEHYVDDSSHSLYGRSAACDAMADMTKDHPQARAGVIAYLTKWLELGADESDQPETFRAFVIVSLLNMEAREALPTIERTFVEDTIDDTVVSIGSLVRHFGESTLGPEARALAEQDRPGGASLHLHCRQCGIERHYPVRHVLIDIIAIEKKAEQDETVFIREDLTCRKCGALNDFEVSGKGTLSLMGFTLRKAFGHDMASEGVRHTRPTVMGKDMAACDGLRLYERLLKRRPEDAELHLGYANLLHMAWRCDEALEHYHKAIELAGEDATTRAHALMRIGWVHGERGQVEDAHRALEAVQSQSDHHGIDPELARGFKGAARMLLDRLDRDGMIDHDLLLSNQEDGGPIAQPIAETHDDDPPEIVLRPAAKRLLDRPSPPAARRKVARNAPCPCGSGRKFKKCCGKS